MPPMSPNVRARVMVLPLVIIIIVVFLFLLALPLEARVVCVEISSRGDVLAGKMFDTKADLIKDDKDIEFTIQHMLIAREVVSELGEHSLFFVADKRIVLPHGLSNQIGITKNIDHNGIACKYVGLVSGDTVVLPAGSIRQVTANAPSRLIVCGRGDAEVTVPGEATGRGVPPWIG